MEFQSKNSFSFSFHKNCFVKYQSRVDYTSRAKKKKVTSFDIDNQLPITLSNQLSKQTIIKVYYYVFDVFRTSDLIVFNEAYLQEKHLQRNSLFKTLFFSIKKGNTLSIYFIHYHIFVLFELLKSESFSYTAASTLFTLQRPRLNQWQLIAEGLAPACNIRLVRQVGVPWVFLRDSLAKPLKAFAKTVLVHPERFFFWTF